MSEHKKVAFSTIGPVKKVKKKSSKSKTVRLNIKLPESNEKYCPEFSYGDLLSHHLVVRIFFKCI